jgi:hypothetical protein
MSDKTKIDKPVAKGVVHDFVASQLGKRPDRELSSIFGISVYYLKKLRIQLRIPSYEESYPKEMIDLLGKVKDREICQRFSVSATSVFRLRVKYGIQSFRGNSKHTVDAGVKLLHKPWTPEDIALLGQVTDAELARKMGIAVDCVSSKRRDLGIERKARIWTKDNIALLGVFNDSEVARKIGLGVTTAAVKNKRQKLKIEACRIRTSPPSLPRANATLWTPEALGLLGKISDYALAKKSGIERSAITVMRNKNGIAPFSIKGRTWNWTDDQLSLLGTAPDGVVAIQIGGGIHRSTVSGKRKKLNIAAFRQ